MVVKHGGETWRGKGGGRGGQGRIAGRLEVLVGGFQGCATTTGHSHTLTKLDSHTLLNLGSHTLAYLECALAG